MNNRHFTFNDFHFYRVCCSSRHCDTLWLWKRTRRLLRSRSTEPKTSRANRKNIIIIDANYNGDNAIVIDFLQDSVDTLTFINCTELDATCSAYVNIIMGEGNGGAFVTVRGSDEYQSIDKYKKYGAPVFFKKNHQVNTYVFEMETTANLQTARICSYENLNMDGKIDDNFSPPRTVLFSVAGSPIATGKQQTPYITPDDVKITLVSYEINPGGGLVLDSSACIGSSGSCKSYENAISVLEKTIVNIFELTGDKTSRDLSVTPPSTMTKLSLREMAGSLTVKSTDIKISTNNNQDFALKLIGTGAFQEKSTNIYDKAQCYLESSSHGVSKIEYTINDDPSEFYAVVYEDSADFHVPDLTIAGDKSNLYSFKEFLYDQRC